MITDYEDISIFSGRPAECKHHLIYGSLRKLADADGLTIPLTNAEHNMSPDGLTGQIHGNPAAEKLSKICGQLAWEKHYIAVYGSTEPEARDKFRERYGISFL